MPKFIVNCERVETYTAAVEWEAESAGAAIAAVEGRLATLGWDSVFHGEDGDYESCDSSVTVAAPADGRGSPDARGPCARPPGECFYCDRAGGAGKGG